MHTNYTETYTETHWSYKENSENKWVLHIGIDLQIRKPSEKSTDNTKADKFVKSRYNDNTKADKFVKSRFMWIE